MRLSNFKLRQPGWVSRFRLGGLARSTLVVFAWNIARLGAQLVWVLLLARVLGAKGYGGFSGIAGLAIGFSGLVGVGLGLRMYQDVARDPKVYSRRWAQASVALGFSAVLLAATFVVLGHYMFPQVPWTLLVAIAVAELALAPAAQQVAFAYAAHGWMSRAAAVPVALSIGRVFAVVLLPWAPWGNELSVYALLHLLSTAVVVVLVWQLCRHEIVRNRVELNLGWGDIREGVGFSSVWASGLALGSLDKAMALQQGGAQLAGNYTAAQRFASIAALPVDALVTAVMPHLFRAGGGQTTHPRLVALLSLVTAGYGILAGLALWWSANLLPWLLGSGFDSSVSAMRVLSFCVPAYCMRSLGSNILLGFGWKGWRFASEMAAIILMATLMAWWIPVMGIVGAARATLASEVFLALLVWSKVGFGSRRMAIRTA